MSFFDRRPRRPFTWTRLATLAVSLALASLASAQTTSTLSGRASDASGAVLSGVSVIARNLETGVVRAAVTGTDGRYAFGFLPVGRYELRAELQGFRSLVR